MAMERITLNSRIQTAMSKTEVESKTLQNQIVTKQQSLNRLSSDSKKTSEEKEKEAQEIRQQIEELQQKLKMLQQEKKREKLEKTERQEEKKERLEELTSSEAGVMETRVYGEKAGRIEEKEKVEKQSNKEESKGAEETSYVPADKLQKMLAVDSLWQQERLQESVANKEERRENTLAAEIKSDAFHGNESKVKKQELSDMRRKEPLDINSLNKPVKKTFVGSDSSDVVYTLNHI